MKSYPKLYYYNPEIMGEKIWAFDKIDGQNFRAEANFKRGFYKFGSRTQMVDIKDELFGPAIKLFMEKYSDGLMNIFSKKYGKDKFSKFTVFCEYHGENSFAGKHNPKDKMDISLIDVNIYKNGIVHPQRFIDEFGHLGIPKLIYEGELNKDLIHDIQINKFNLKEGVVAKNENFMVKIKTLEWLNKVKSEFGEKFLLEDLDGKMELFTSLHYDSI